MSYWTRSANTKALQYFGAFALYKLAAHQLTSQHNKKRFLFPLKVENQLQKAFR